MTETTISARKAFRLSPVLLVATTNPKKKPSMSYDRFQGYFDYKWSEDPMGTTVQDLLDAGTIRMDDIKHDQAHGFIVVGEADITAHLEALEQAKEDAIAAAKALLASLEEEEA